VVRLGSMYGGTGYCATHPKHAQKDGYLRNDLMQVHLPPCRPMVPVSHVIYRYCKWLPGWKEIYGGDFDGL
jgi:hypothetical protein